MKFASVLLAVFFAFSAVYAGTIDPNLTAKIEKSDPQTKYSTIIFMRDQLDVAPMKHQQDLLQATRAERHSEVITALQTIASQSQPDLLSYLGQAQVRGTVGAFRGFWIANMVIAELTADEIKVVAARPDVATVYSDFRGELIKPVPGYGELPPTIASNEVGLRDVRADSAWFMGYTGHGRLVCNIDTGVDGNHPALNYKWRGNNGFPPEQSWLDTANPSNQFPHDENDHGTHTMGTMCGRSTITPDTVGVAIDAEWIAARAVDVTGGNISAAFQWAADPDGDPNTLEDVPDVISNSWGSLPQPGNECPPDFYSLIDNCEAAGAAVVFAAGNEGSAPQTLRIPANRITTPYNCFAVGAIDGNNPSFPIAGFSSRGPSQCDGVTIKPEVVAPGVSVRSSVPGGGYQSVGWSGTSMACPHIAGAIAILRQVNPNASVDTLKWALMHSARDLGGAGEDNTYGWGIINIKAAIALVPPINSPYVYPNTAYVVDGNDNYPDPGETISLFVRLRNSGIGATGIAAVVSTADPFTTVLQDSAFYGDIAQNDTSRTTTAYSISFASNTPPGRHVALDFRITGDGAYSVSRRLGLTVGRLAAAGIATFNIGNVGFTVSNFGQYGLAPDGMNPNWTGVGFKMPRTGTNYLFEGAFLVGNGPTRVSNGARDENEAVSVDFQPVASIDTLQPGTFGDQEYHSQFNDQGAPEPLNVEITDRSFAWAATPDNDYVIIEYTIKNLGATQLDSVLVAHFEDWDIPYGSPTDRANFDRARNLGYQYSGINYRGQQVLSDLGVFSFKALDNSTEVYPPRFTRADKWSYMNAGTTDTSFLTGTDASMMITTGPYNIASGDSVVAAFAILGGTSLTDLRTNADAAMAKYATRVSVSEDPVTIPDNFSLSQNYPNPFNAKTTIQFGIPVSGHVTLETFDLLGRRVTVLVNGQMEAGTHSISWDCTNVPSGVYFYRLTQGNKSTVRKMTLLK